MNKINSVKGNINTNPELNQRFLSLVKSDELEFLELSRFELEKTRLRKKTNRGTELGIVLQKSLQEGDVLDSDKFIVVKQSKEMVACITLQKRPADSTELFEILVYLGHTIGNRHRPISIEGGKIYFPIHSEEEIQTFAMLLSKYKEMIKLEAKQQVFKPQTGMNVHEH